MLEIVTALVGAASLITVAVVEKRSRSGERRWDQNDKEHEMLINKIEDIGSNLGRSLDRVEAISVRTELKLDQHINDHVTGKLVD